MTRNSQQYLNNIIRQESKYYLDLSGQQLSGEMNLTNFVNLRNINASDNKFTSLDFLSTLPNKEKLEKINLFGNEIEDINSIMWLFRDFPNLKEINLSNNPLSGRNLGQINSEQFAQLVESVKSKKLKINSWRGSLLMDLLEYAQILFKHTQPLSNHRQQNCEQSQLRIAENQQNTCHNLSVRANNFLTQKSISALVMIAINSLFACFWLKKIRKIFTKKKIDY